MGVPSGNAGRVHGGSDQFLLAAREGFAGEAAIEAYDDIGSMRGGTGAGGARRSAPTV